MDQVIAKKNGAAATEALPRRQRFVGLRRFAGNRLAVVGAAIILLLVLVAIFAPLLADRKSVV